MSATEETPPIPETPPGAAREVVLRTEGLTKRYGVRTAVNNLALEVRRGDVFGLLGPNGSGKTTTLRMLLGLVWPLAGSISLFGENMASTASRRAALKRIGAIVEQPSFYPFLTGPENLHGIATFAGMPDNATTRARVSAVLEQVGLAERDKDSYRKYSLGMKQRLGIAAALLNSPDMMILDEPTNGLDPAGMVEVRALIGQLATSGVTVMLASHLLHEVQQVCTRVAILKEGNLLAQGAVSDLLATSSGVVIGFADAEQLPRAAGALLQARDAGAVWLRDVRYVLPEPGAWTPPGGWLLRVDASGDHSGEINALLAGQGIYAAELRRSEGNLEQYFLALTGATNGMTAPASAAAAPAMPQGGQA
ncbi:MAG: Efflux ABC transporter, ATP-binding protein [Ktedonobacterales bacterium]|jgi:ABC-2 type transport system ATP-binding protein|nr:MAG: Efflux ABC transporter, ATP-binding protein [Ktedonobacterales bacterium]